MYERHRLWSADGTWERPLQQAQAAADAAGEIDWGISVDSTITRAHQHAAGARVKDGRSGRTPGRNTMVEPARRLVEWCGRRGPGPLAGRVHQQTPPVHLSDDGRCRPLALVVTGGPRADCTQIQTVLAKIRVPRGGLGRTCTKPDGFTG
ncbi:hypothetical protein [Streptomyces sp. NPDC054808]